MGRLVQEMKRSAIVILPFAVMIFVSTTSVDQIQNVQVPIH